MFMQKVMQQIRVNETAQYKKYFEQGQSMTDNELYDCLKDVKATIFSDKYNNLSNLATCGCSYYKNNGTLSGCSMCNLHSESIKQTAYMTCLRLKNQTLYSKVVLRSFINARGILANRTIHEFLYAYSFFDEMEIPDECLEMLFGREGVFKKRPFVLEIETSVKHINEHKINLIKKYLPGTKIWVRFGAECSSQILRNNWLNKNISDNDIRFAIEVCHKNDVSVTANILFGIPGYAERFSIEEFVQTVSWLRDLQIDRCSCSILGRKENTLQGYLYNNLRNDPNLMSLGIADGDHTGLPWIFSFLNALSLCETTMPEMMSKIVFGQFEPDYIQGIHTTAYNAIPQCKCINSFNKIIKSGKYERIGQYYDMYTESRFDPCYSSYEKMLNKQSGIKDPIHNMDAISIAISKTLWTDWMSYYNEYFTEIHR